MVSPGNFIHSNVAFDVFRVCRVVFSSRLQIVGGDRRVGGKDFGIRHVELLEADQPPDRNPVSLDTGPSAAYARRLRDSARSNRHRPILQSLFTSLYPDPEAQTS